MRCGSVAGLFVLCLVAMTALRVVLPGPELVPSPWNLLGVPPVLLGVALHRRATRLLRRRGTTLADRGRPSRLVTDGVFRLTRNPMYLAGVLILTGTGVILGVLTPILVVPLFVHRLLVDYIRREERILEERFGTDYLRYRSRVRRWI